MRALVLAGGRSSRFNGVDKTFVPLAGRALVEHVIARLTPQVTAIAISSNKESGQFAHLAQPVIADVVDDIHGPLAGIYAGLVTWPGDELLTVAVDLPFLPLDLASRLRAGRGPRLCAYASDGTHHAAAVLWRPGAAMTVAAFLGTGGRSLKALLAAEGVPVVFTPDLSSDITFNINTPEDLAAAESRLHTVP